MESIKIIELEDNILWPPEDSYLYLIPIEVRYNIFQKTLYPLVPFWELLMKYPNDLWLKFVTKIMLKHSDINKALEHFKAHPYVYVERLSYLEILKIQWGLRDMPIYLNDFNTNELFYYWNVYKVIIPLEDKVSENIHSNITQEFMFMYYEILHRTGRVKTQEEKDKLNGVLNSIIDSRLLDEIY